MTPAAYSPKRTALLRRLRQALVHRFVSEGKPAEWAEVKATEVIQQNKHNIHRRSQLRDAVAQLELAEVK